jgi:biopolymer transport protein ExbD
MLVIASRRRSKIAIQLTPLIDMVFLLLIYFLLTSNFVTQEGIDVQLPQVEMPTTAAEQLTVITVHRHGAFSCEGKMMNDKELADALGSSLRQASRPDVVIKGDRDVHYERVVTAMDIAKMAGAQKLHLAIERKVEGRQ